MIAFNYDSAMTQSRELDKICDDLMNLIRLELQPGAQEVGAAWKGESARIFLEKNDELMTHMRKTVRIASSVAEAVRISAKAIRDAEEKAKQIVQEIVT